MKLNFKLTLRRAAAPHKRKRRIALPPQALYLTAIILLALGIGGGILGIYRVVDKTLTASEEVLRLRQEVSEESFRTDDFLTAVESLEKKTAQPEPPDWSAIVNPFLANRP
ncbi:MAG: hypothetical protein G01um101431_346 [Parcubacteria group bacterium Gr01-1014_31]|nr:MAG: hypothetical protein G01um101431_346 [Parcubacteria group bacterium Gr01-1014_31]